MTILSIIPNVNASVDWWTSAQAARDFWLAFAGIGVAIWGATALRSRQRTNIERR